MTTPNAWERIAGFALNLGLIVVFYAGLSFLSKLVAWWCQW